MLSTVAPVYLPGRQVLARMVGMEAHHRVGLFARKLEERRAAAGLFHRAFAAEIGCHESVWARIRTGERGVSRELAHRVIAKWPEFRDYYAADVLPKPSEEKGG